MSNRIYTALFHITCWVFVALPMVVFVPPHEERGPLMQLMRLSFPMLTCAVFYINYLWLVPQFFLKDQRRTFIAINTAVIILFAFCSQGLMGYMHTAEIGHSAGQPAGIMPLLMWLLGFIGRNVFILALSAGIATLLRLAMKWQQVDDERRELEMQKTEAELKNLRNQINPHFLLNTLNNIFALIAFDQDRAQKAVLSLSSLLRQMLYGSDENAVEIEKEVDFLNNYINLMRLRMSRNVDISVNMDVREQGIRVAPFIFISLVENAFKHGVSMTEPCFISIRLTADRQQVECEIKNSNFPKADSDRSGHGIGLTQVARRLGLAYPNGRYEWTKGVDKEKKTYISKIILYDTKLCNN